MAPAFSKEAILQGCIDHLCLACESYLRSERDVCEHVATAAHRRNLAATHYVDNYSQHRIRKVKKWYYCEFCNILIFTVAKIRLHVEEPMHKENIASQTIARVDDVTYFGNIAISDDAWHGFLDENTCTICNTEFEDKYHHMKDSIHIINLIQSKLHPDLNNTYRKIDETTFHCLTCNTVVAGITAHIDDTKHKNIIQKCIKITPEKKESPSLYALDIIDDKSDLINQNADDLDEGTKLSGNKTTLEINSNAKLDPQVANKPTSDILESISIFQHENIDINFESRRAICRRCSVNLEFDSKIIEGHVKEHKNNPKNKVNATTSWSFEKDEKNKARDGGTLFTSPVSGSKENVDKVNIETKPTETRKHKDDNVIQKMAEEHDLTYTANKLYCQRCNKHIPSSVRNINEHVNGASHINNTKLSGTATQSKDNENKKITSKKHNLQRVPIHQFVRTVTTVKNMFAEDVVINEKYCINLLAFTFLTMTSPGQLRCQACEVNLRLQDIGDHSDVKSHERALNEVPVIIHTDSEFIREIRSEVFQCGFCNIIDCWEGMEVHLKSASHKESKNFANWRLSQHLPKIHQHNMHRQIQNDFLLRLMFS